MPEIFPVGMLPDEDMAPEYTVWWDILNSHQEWDLPENWRSDKSISQVCAIQVTAEIRFTIPVRVFDGRLAFPLGIDILRYKINT